MGILTDLCMIIDLHNVNKKDKKKTLLNIIDQKREEKEIKRVISRITDNVLIKNSTVEEFLYIYNSTKDIIKFKTLDANYNETNNVLYMKYKNSNSILTLALTKGDSYKINVKFQDLVPGTYPVSFTTFDVFYYNGTDKKRVSIMEYANDVVRTFMKDYFLLRLKK